MTNWKADPITDAMIDAGVQAMVHMAAGSDEETATDMERREVRTILEAAVAASGSPPSPAEKPEAWRQMLEDGTRLGLYHTREEAQRYADWNTVHNGKPVRTVPLYLHPALASSGSTGAPNGQPTPEAKP